MRNNFNTDSWLSKLRRDIEAGHPIFYAGYTQEWAGHAFVLDGVDGRNTKDYVQGIPVFGREDYFNDGKVDVSVAEVEAPWKFIIYYTKYGARY